jgi:hypothetical protein
MQEQGKFHVSQPEAQAQEPVLPARERGERASQLISVYWQALNDTPEFAQAHKKARISASSRTDNPYHFADKIKFTKANTSYNVVYENGVYDKWLGVRKTRLYILKHTPEVEDQYTEYSTEHDETVNLFTFFDKYEERIVDGHIQYEKRDADGNTFDKAPDNKLTTIQRVEDFLTTSFGDQ